MHAGTGVKYYQCVACFKRTIPSERRFIFGETYKSYQKHLGLDSCRENDVTCLKCYLRYKRKLSKPAVDTSTCTPTDPDYVPPCAKKIRQELRSPQNIPLPIISSGNSHSTCCICKRRSPKLLSVSAESRYRLFVEKGHLLLPGSRCCCFHIGVDNYFKEDVICLIKDDPLKELTFFNKTEIVSLINNVRAIALRNERYRIDFDNRNALSDLDYLTLTGLTKDDFEDICSHIEGTSIRCTKNRSSRTCVALLLVKLRTGMSNRLLSTLFNIGKSSIRRAIVSARQILTANFTPKYIGFQHITRDDVIEKHTSPLAQELFGTICEKPAILVVDGTYIYIQKSNNFKFQRRSYSMHKNRPLVKPLVIVTTTGYIVSVQGPYHADSKNNDASTLKHTLQSNMEHMKEWLEDDDTLVVDRGFRDSLDFLAELGIKCKMPAFLDKGQKQHTTEEANSSRLITKIRWIVESVNGRLKQWKYLQNVIPNSQIPAIGDNVRLIAALCNRYRTPLNSGSKDTDELLAAKMKVLASKSNTLQERVHKENLERRTLVWKQLDAENGFPDFPSLSEEELRNITVGVYQLKLARSYTAEHLSEDGEYSIMLNDGEDGLLRVRIQSRHTSSKSYLLWIEYSPAVINGWYCQCKAGARVVGTCAHIAAVIWYLGYARHVGTVRGVKDWSLYLEDAANVPTIIDDSESGSDSDPEE